MIIYFTNRQLEVIGQASTSLPSGLRIIDDETVEDIETGCNNFSCKIHCNGKPRNEVERLVQEGHFVIKSSGRAFTDKQNTYDSLYQIIETEFDALNNQVYIYAEDAGLDLINKIVDAATLENYTLEQMLDYFLPDDWSVKLNGTPTETKTYTWEGENTAIERIKSIVSLFGCEVFYSFVIERMKIVERCVNVIPKRGSDKPVAQLRLDREITNIITKKSISNLATAFVVTGATIPETNEPTNLIGYEYSYTDYETGDEYEVDTTTGQMRNVTQMAQWASSLDSDGLILKRFTFDTTDQAILAGQARAALQKQCYPEVNYECNIKNLPSHVRIGDRVNIIDTEGQLYLEARILELSVSVSSNSITAVLGEYKIKEGGISDIISQLASDLSARVRNGLDSITITVSSSGGFIFHNQAISTTLTASVFVGQRTISTQSELEDMFGSGAQIRWYSGSTLLGTGFTYSVSSAANEVRIVCKLYTEEA